MFVDPLWLSNSVSYLEKSSVTVLIVLHAVVSKATGLAFKESYMTPQTLFSLHKHIYFRVLIQYKTSTDKEAIYVLS